MRTRPVFEDHLRHALEEEPCMDLRSWFAEDCIIVASFGTFHGRDGVCTAAELLEQELPNARYRYDDRVYQGELCFLSWTAEADGTRVDDGADSFLIQDGAIKVMTIHYTAMPLPPVPPDGDAGGVIRL